MPKIIRVRIAVAVNTAGAWCASGADVQGDEKATERASSGWGPNIVHFVEADVPVPESSTVEGKATD